MFDVDHLRSLFPALTRTDGSGRPYLYADGPAGTQVPRSVIAAVAAGMAEAASNVGGHFEASRSSEAVVAGARQAAADLVGGSPDEIIFGANMTTVTFAFSRALAQTWSSGDRIVLSGLDHDANVSPWLRAAADRGAEVVFADVTADATLDLDHLESLIDHRTRLVAVTGCSNAFGSRVDVGRVASAAHAVGALCYVDAVHLAPHVRIDVADLGVDFLVCSAYKFYGPHVGILWGRAELLAATEAYKVRPAPSEPPGRFETGTPSFALFAGVTAAVDHIASLGEGPDRGNRLDDAYRVVGAHERALGERLLAGLPTGIRLWGPPTMDGRVSTFAVGVDGMTADQASARLGERGIFTWSGHYYAIEPMRRLGLLDQGGLVRIGLVATTTEEEVDRLLAELADLLS
ncbi:MAG: cysteine desulfurase-like protein [Acidimicrobiia bacterium]